jgi:ABC-2 type transport system ATP-binding protein
MNAIVEVRGLDKSYDGVAVVRNVNLTIAAGECFALLGPNGAGKTTIIDILAGFRGRDGGTVGVLGIDPEQGGRGWRSRVGFVGQNLGAALDLTVAECLRHFARYHSCPWDSLELISAVGLAEKVDTRVAKLSGGQRRRLDVALGIQGHPDVLFLDEPTTGLDPQGRRKLWSVLAGLKAGGTTVLLTTHYLEEAAFLADRVGVLAHGRLLQSASPDRVGAGLLTGATVVWDEDGRRHEVDTQTPSLVVRGLLGKYGGLEVPGLAIHRPSLEDAYLALLAADEPSISLASRAAVSHEVAK